MKGIYFKKKGISFTTSLTIYISLFLMYDLFNPIPIAAQIGTKTIAMVGIYMIIGLASRDYDAIGVFVERIWSLNCTNGVKENIKMANIKSYIAIYIAQWNRYWRMWQDINNGVEDTWTWKDEVSDQLKRIPKGSLSLTQITWIIGYVIYNLVRISGYLDLTPLGVLFDFHIIFDIVSLSFFSYTSGIVLGMDKFMSNIFESVKPVGETEIIERLSILKEHIIGGARRFGFLRDMIEFECEPDICEIPIPPVPPIKIVKEKGEVA
ncbi:MAG: hypothetical protein GY870_12480 [archaeon]|nr:hypothetical protein [archaeon]